MINSRINSRNNSTPIDPEYLPSNFENSDEENYETDEENNE